MANKKEMVKIETPKGLKVLCIMSFIGFALAMAVDTGNYLSYSSIDALKSSANQSGWEMEVAGSCSE